MLELCWRYFSLWGALGPLLRVSWLLVGILGRFLGVLFAFLDALGSILEGSGLVWGGFGSLPVVFVQCFFVRMSPRFEQARDV